MSTTPTADDQREFALEVVRRLRNAGRQALWAGGCVRDRLLGKAPKDYDVATDAPPDAVRDLFGRRRTVAVGAAFGVITVLGKRGAAPIEVATFRSDDAYVDGRRPSGVRYTSAEEDAKRRDFTINGLFYDPIGGRVIDYVGGRDDLAAGVVRAIGVADERFAEDRLRMLRAVRFAASLGFELDPATAKAIRGHADAIAQVSPERIGAEVKRVLTESDPPRGLVLMRQVGLLRHTLGELDSAGPEALAAATGRLARLTEPSAPLALAAALADAATPAEAVAVAKRLRWTNKEQDLAAWLLAGRGALADAPRAAWSDVQPLLAAEGGADLVALHAADGASQADLDFCRQRLAWPRDRLDPPPLLVGADLIAAGRRPGPGFAALLAAARRAQLDGRATDKASALREIGIAPPAAG
ncbi:CCA tRNA nucleotidyltransferase [Botrimarina sp.]|uniref:CCA tRNA nucleotidyltransferase n=1 Tax=Botrimarina sp. TaxID=2795802 RepID=UPI0032EF409D